MKNFSWVKKTLQEQKSALSVNYGVKEIGLFGSVTKGAAALNVYRDIARGMIK